MAGIKQGSSARAWKIEGLGELLEKLQGEPIYARPWRRALLEMLKYGKAVAQSRAMRGKTGKLASRIRYHYPRVPVPLYGVISVSASNKGFRYPFALDSGHGTKKNGMYQFHRLGSGSSTRDWFTGVLPVIHPRCDALISAAEKDTEANWS